MKCHSEGFVRDGCKTCRPCPPSGSKRPQQGLRVKSPLDGRGGRRSLADETRNTAVAQMLLYVFLIQLEWREQKKRESCLRCGNELSGKLKGGTMCRSNALCRTASAADTLRAPRWRWNFLLACAQWEGEASLGGGGKTTFKNKDARCCGDSMQTVRRHFPRRLKIECAGIFRRETRASGLLFSLDPTHAQTHTKK